ncbi:MAG: hypothetical protein JO013_05500 [Alphaproteobacteria bacterium]|nr:hypothetical protein [Alphaproteobacteria bacterium]
MMRGLILIAALLLAGAAPPPASVGGVWDLTWKNAHGETRGAWLLMRQQGRHVDAELHGRHNVNASGLVEGSRVELRGSRLLIPYRIVARVAGDRIEGGVSAPGFERRFTGQRRRG